jgi:hypothetical protein
MISVPSCQERPRRSEHSPCVAPAHLAIIECEIAKHQTMRKRKEIIARKAQWQATLEQPANQQRDGE